MPRRHLALFLSLLAASCHPTSPQRPVVENAAPPTAAAASTAVQADRRYVEPHEVGVVCDQPPAGEDMCSEQAEDTLTMHALPNGNVAVSIELQQTNGHTCSFEDTLVAAPASEDGEQRWTFTKAESDDAGACALELVQRRDEIVISAEGCRDYCGVRASLDARFARHDGP